MLRLTGTEYLEHDIEITFSPQKTDVTTLQTLRVDESFGSAEQ